MAVTVPEADPTSKRRRLDGKDATTSRIYSAQRILGKGSFGVVYQAQVMETGEIVAIKSIRMQEKDREVQILKELDGHPNIVALKGAFVSSEGTSQETKLNLVLEYLSDTLHRVIKHYNKDGKVMDHYHVKLYFYQVLRGLAFIHGKGIIHCDIKPQNLLLDGGTQALKLCDFGTAKRVVPGEGLRPYVCSRYYRAPELILGSPNYTTSIDLWSSGCVFAEMLLGQPLFTGKDGIHQFVEIIKILGTPSNQELRAMNANYPEYDFEPKVESHSWSLVFKNSAPPEANDLARLLMKYNPMDRLPPMQALLHPFFHKLRAEDKPMHRILFNFRPDELWWCTAEECEQLVPAWCTQKEPIKEEQ